MLPHVWKWASGWLPQGGRTPLRVSGSLTSTPWHLMSPFSFNRERERERTSGHTAG